MLLKNVIGISTCVLIFALGLLFLHRNDFKNSEIKNGPTIQSSQKDELPTAEIPSPLAESNKDPKNIKPKPVDGDNTISPTPIYGDYKDYSPQSILNESKNGKKVVLFFHAPWCPYCRAADEVFRDRVQDIPKNVVILKTDYDSNSELKKKYGVTYQHTFVQVDSTGLLITKWNGGDLDNLNKYLK